MSRKPTVKGYVSDRQLRAAIDAAVADVANPVPETQRPRDVAPEVFVEFAKERSKTKRSKATVTKMPAQAHDVVHHQTAPVKGQAVPRAAKPEQVLHRTEHRPRTEPPKQSQFVKMHTQLQRPVLQPRPPGAPTILDELPQRPIKLIIHQGQSPGDILMLTAAIRDLHLSYPGKFLTKMQTTCGELWQHNPYAADFQDDDTVHRISAEYTLINQSNTGPFHFIHGFILDLENKLGLPIRPTEFKGHITLGENEKLWMSQIREQLHRDVPFWIIDAGHKSDFTAKHWGDARYQEVVTACPDIWFVQIGATTPGHVHRPLKGDNVINLVGRTDLRQMVRLMHHAAGVITPVSFPMHLSAAVEMHPRYRRRYRPTIVLGGGREPAVWEAYSNHQFLHTSGMLPCCAEGGCWRSRVMPIGDGDIKDKQGLCLRPVRQQPTNQVVPACMDMISSDEVVQKIRMAMKFYDYEAEDANTWRALPDTDIPADIELERQAVLQKKA